MHALVVHTPVCTTSMLQRQYYQLLRDTSPTDIGVWRSVASRRTVQNGVLQLLDHACHALR